jgi:hypothetical protein
MTMKRLISTLFMALVMWAAFGTCSQAQDPRLSYVNGFYVVTFDTAVGNFASAVSGVQIATLLDPGVAAVGIEPNGADIYYLPAYYYNSATGTTKYASGVSVGLSGVTVPTSSHKTLEDGVEKIFPPHEAALFRYLGSAAGGTLNIELFSEWPTR